MSLPNELHDHDRLARVLGLGRDADADAIRRAADRLLGALRRAQDRIDSTEPQHSRAIPDRPESAMSRQLEIDELEAGVERWIAQRSAGDLAYPPARATGQAAKTSKTRSSFDRNTLLGAALGAFVMLAILIAYGSGFRVTRMEDRPSVAPRTESAHLIILGDQPGATLRVMDADRQQVFAKIPAAGAHVELTEGRYVVEVAREDCPDSFSRSLYFEAGETLRFEPEICAGSGTLVVRSDLEGDRLLIDGFDVGSTGPTPHTLSVGDHVVRVEKRGYAPFESEIRVTPGGELVIRAELSIARTARQAIEEQAARAKRAGAIDFGAMALGKIEASRPEPFDLDALRDQMTPPPTASRHTRLLRRSGLGALSEGGSTAWHDRVKGELLTRFDADRSGALDNLREVESIPCVIWQEVEADFDRGGLGLTLARYYGFDGSEWHEGALGFSRAQRSVGYERIKECNLRP